jgi:hypothetical protein
MADLRRALGRAASAKMLKGGDLTPNRGRVATPSCRCAREGSASAAATCGVTGTRRRNRCGHATGSWSTHLFRVELAHILEVARLAARAGARLGEG